MPRYRESHSKSIESWIPGFRDCAYHKATVEDTETGEKGKGVGKAQGEATRNAYRDLREKQGG